MADHEMDLRAGLIEYQLRCICEPGAVIGSYFLESSANAAFKAHLKAKDVKPPIDHRIILRNRFLSGAACSCSCGEDLGTFSSEKSAILAWRKHSGK